MPMIWKNVKEIGAGDTNIWDPAVVRIWNRKHSGKRQFLIAMSEAVDLLTVQFGRIDLQKISAKFIIQ